MNNDASRTRSLAEITSDLSHELTSFVQTRIELLKSELQERLNAFKKALPLGVLGAVLLATFYLLLVLSIVAATAVVFRNSPYRWFLAFLGIGALWLVLGGVAWYFAMREFELKRVLPRRTLEVLNGDRIWLQNETSKTM